MSKVYVDITQWPCGQSLDIGNENGSTSVAGPHGGGVGHIIKRFTVNTDRLLEAIRDNAFGGEDDENS